MSDRRYFNVVLVSSFGTSVRQVDVGGGEMFNAELLELDVANDINKDGLLVDKVFVSHWTEFKSESDFKQFMKGKELPR